MVLRLYGSFLGKDNKFFLIICMEYKKNVVSLCELLSLHCKNMGHVLDLFHFCPKCGSQNFVENNEKSKRCEACDFVYYFNPSAATVAVIRNKRGEVLCVRRAKDPAKGTLDLPGGFCDCYETSEEGVCREVMEETGLRVTRTQFLFSIPNQYPYSGFVVHTIDAFYLCEVEGEEQMEAHDDAAEALWLPVSELKSEEFGLKSISLGIEKLKKILNI